LIFHSLTNIDKHGYFDKTGLTKQLIDQEAPHYFISCPKRFEKSLFINTLIFWN